VWLLQLVLVAVACSNSTPPMDDGGPPIDGGYDSGVIPDAGEVVDAGYPYDDATQVGAVCHSAMGWTPGNAIFEEVTVDAGLLGVQGDLVDAVDVDGDGWADLVVRYLGQTGEAPVDYTETHTDPWTPPWDGGLRQIWVLRNDHHGGFQDITQSSGILTNRDPQSPANLGRPGIAFAFGDIDNDGLIDVYDGYNPMGASGFETSEILLNNGDGTFRLGPTGSPIGHPPGADYDTPAGGTFVDVDRDGNLDLFVAEEYIPNASQPWQNERLYHGDGHGNFTDITADAGLITANWINADGSGDVADLNVAFAKPWGWGTTACDLNGDGNPELMVMSYGRAPNHLWQNEGVGSGVVTFRNESVQSGYAFDDNEDWTGDQSARCYCKWHPTEPPCAGCPAPISDWYCGALGDGGDPSGWFRWNDAYGRDPFSLGGNNESTACADINNDGYLDLITGADAHWDVGPDSDRGELLVNSGTPNVSFGRPGNTVTGLGRFYDFQTWNESTVSVSAYDFDGDGWLDIYWGNSEYFGDYGLLFHQDSPMHFSKVSTADGIIQIARANGSALADFDHDGRQEIVVGSSLWRCPDVDCPPSPQIHLYRNVYSGYGNFIELALTGGAGSNRMAIGARVQVTANGITQTHEVGGGYGRYTFQDELVQHFGLGAACDATVTIRWPNAALTTETFKLPAGHRFAITQGGKPTAVF
jgi:enediyne biosynthesis protein E4